MFQEKCGENLRAKIYEPEGHSKDRNVREFYGTSVILRKVTSLELI
jgi:hypothetical protein